jgi:hypothetical protein
LYGRFPARRRSPPRRSLSQATKIDAWGREGARLSLLKGIPGCLRMGEIGVTGPRNEAWVKNANGSHFEE